MVFSTQQAIEIAGVKDGVVILKNGGFRMILQVSAVNFQLKSEQEQNSLVFNFQSFLNSLHFPIEIVVRSKRLDLAPYIEKIKGLVSKQPNELIRVQTEDYADFVSKLIGLANIMKKTYYVVVSYDPINIKNVNFMDRLFKKGQVFDHIKMSDTEFKANFDHLMERSNIVASGLGSMGLHCFQLSSDQIVELFYQIYNPEIAGKERVANPEDLAASVIMSKSEVREELTEKEAVQSQVMIDNSAVVQATIKQEAQQNKDTTTATPKPPEPKAEEKKEAPAPPVEKAPEQVAAEETTTVSEEKKV